MRISIASDLHLEFETIELPNTSGADVLILSGDICVAHSLHDHPVGKPIPTDAMKPGRNQQAAVKYREFFHHVSQEYDHVIYCLGNHEYYHGRYPDAIEWMRTELQPYSNIHVLDMDSVEINGVVFLGGTLWTNMYNRNPTAMQLIEGMMNDFRIIRNSQQNYRRFTPADAVSHHYATVDFIRRTVDADPMKTYVVVGHHAPTPLSVHEKYKADYYMNAGYASDLSEFILDRPQIKMWTMGHMHDPHRYYMGETLVVCNPRGYANHDPGATNFKLVTIDLDNMPEKFEGVQWSRD